MKFLFTKLEPKLFPIKELCVIYCIRNTVNGKVYVGGTSDLKKRLRLHFWSICGGYHFSEGIKEDALKFGGSCWEWALIENTESKDLAERESFWINELKSHEPSVGYNVFASGFRGPNKEHKEQFKAWWAARVKVARMVSPDGLVVVDVVSRIDFAKEYGLDVKEVYAVISGRLLHTKGWALESTARRVLYSPTGKRYSYVSSRNFGAIIGCSLPFSKLERKPLSQSNGWSQTFDKCLLNKPLRDKVPTKIKVVKDVTAKKPIGLVSPDGHYVEFDSRCEAIKAIGGDRSMIYKMISRRKCGGVNVLSYHGWRLPMDTCVG
jgi:hypothetical protein